MKTILSTATIGLLCTGALAGAGDPRSELIVDNLPGDAALCPPCMGLWVTNLPAGSAAKFVIMDEGASPLPFEIQTIGLEAGIGFAAYRPTQRSPVSVFAVVDGQQTDAAGCIPPIHPSGGDCPPPPRMSLQFARPGRFLEVGIGPQQPTFNTAVLLRLDGPPAQWTRVPAPVQYFPRPEPHVTFNAEVGNGLYRAQFMDETGHVLNEQFVRVGDGRRP